MSRFVIAVFVAIAVAVVAVGATGCEKSENGEQRTPTEAREIPRDEPRVEPRTVGRAEVVGGDAGAVGVATTPREDAAVAEAPPAKEPKRKQPETKQPETKRPETKQPAAAAAEDADLAAARKEAQALFQQRCVTCHGAKGDGKGAASASFNPKPRDWTDPAWQKKVTDAEIETVILEGGPAVGLSPLMPGNVDLEDKPAVVRELRKIVRGFGE